MKPYFRIYFKLNNTMKNKGILFFLILLGTTPSWTQILQTSDLYPTHSKKVRTRTLPTDMDAIKFIKYPIILH